MADTARGNRDHDLAPVLDRDDDFGPITAKFFGPAPAGVSQTGVP